MIQRLHMRNFQCHSKRTLKFDKITTITGPSDAGKSAIVRALRWVLLNKPSGAAVVKRGETRCMVTVTVDGHKIKKARKGAKTTYYLGDDEFKAFGNNVPDTIANLSLIGEDNVQKQHDAPFWLSLSSGELSRTLNEVVDLSAIDSTVKTLNQWLWRSTTEAEVAETRLAELREQKKELAFVKDMDAEWKDVETLADAIGALDHLIWRVEKLVAVGISTQRLLSTARTSCRELDASLLEAAGPADRIVRGRKTVRRVQKVLAAYKQVEEGVFTVKAELEAIERQLAKYSTCPLCGGDLK